MVICVSGMISLYFLCSLHDDNNSLGLYYVKNVSNKGSKQRKVTINPTSTCVQ